MSKTIFIYNMKACTTNYYAYVQMANMYYEDCTSNHYVYVLANTYYENCIHLMIMFMYRPKCIMEHCTANHYVYVQANIYYGRLYI